MKDIYIGFGYLSPISSGVYPMVNESISSSKLVTASLNQLDIASSLLSAISLSDDVTKAEAELKVLKNMISSTLSPIQALTNKIRQSPYTIVQSALSELRTYLPQYYDLTKTQAYYARAGWNLAASQVGQIAKLYSQNYFIDMNARILYDLPEQHVLALANKFYRSAFRYEEPNLANMTVAYMRGLITKSRWQEKVAEENIGSQYEDIILDIAEAYPSITTAFRYSEYIDFTDASIEWLCKKNNVTNPQVILLYKNLKNAIQLRDEMRTYRNVCRQARLDGLITADDFKAEMLANKASAAEVDQTCINTETEYLRGLTKLEIQTRTNLYRKGTYGDQGSTANPIYSSDQTTEKYFYSALLSLNMEAATANQIVRFEASKFGIDWEGV